MRTSSQAATPRRLAWLVGALVALEAGALGLKAWDEIQARDQGRLQRLDSEALALAERLNGRVDTVSATLQLGVRSGLGREALLDAVDGIDAVLSVRDAAQAPAGSRIRAAAATATRLRVDDQRVGMTPDGDLVILIESPATSSRLAFARAETWLPKPAGARRLTLAGADRIGIGNPDLADQAETASLQHPAIQSGATARRSATACAPLDASGLQVCSTVPAPLLDRDSLVRLVIYLLLLAAPALAIVGLLNIVARGRSDQEAADTRAATARSELDLVMAGARAGSWSIDAETGIARFSPMAAELLGLDPTVAHDRTALLKSVHERDRHRVESALDSMDDKGWLQVWFATSASEGRAFVELRASPVRTGPVAPAPSRFGGILMDVTEQKIADLRVRTAERRLRNAIEGFSGPFALWDRNKRLLYWNRSFAFDFGLEDTLRPGIGHDTVAMARAAAVRTERPAMDDSHTATIELTSGRWLRLMERATAEKGMITLGIDVTDSVRNEEQLERQKAKLKRLVLDLERSEGHKAELARKYSEEKARAEHAANTKSAFLANMSHELRTPLNAINGFSEMLVEEFYGPLGDARYKEYAQDILASGQHLLDLINDILDMAKIEAGKTNLSRQSIDPVDPVDAAVRMVRRKAEERDIVLTIDAGDALPNIDADHRAIRQMVLNLVSNAIKFTDAGGRIVIGVKQAEGQLCISVTDTGIGIPQDQIARLGSPFEQVAESRERNTEGTGLGLALTRSFAEMHGGRITIASEPGRGTRVSIYLPIEEPEPARDVA